jgi:hypothetical protein
VHYSKLEHINEQQMLLQICHYIEDIYEKDVIKGQIDAHYDRLDLKDDYVRQYKRMSNL